MSSKIFPDDFKRELKMKNDIVSVVSSFVHMDRKGGRYWGCCPFHHEKTPSFTVSETEQVYHCFGCKEHGDVIKFIEKMENVDFPTAVEILAKRAGMTMPEAVSSEVVQKKKSERDRIMKILDVTYKHYANNLLLPEAKLAQEYIKKRGLTKRELESFQLGYSLNWTEMLEYLKKQGFKQEDMVLAGIAQTKDGTRAYDVMAERLVFPIFNSFGECVGFSGRVLVKTDFAKYKNTAENAAFHKGRLVYGVHILKKLRQEQNLQKVILVEGQMDVISMHRAGFTNTVATMGTALTADHAREIKRFSENVVLCYDGDDAGKKAAVRSIDILKEVGLNVMVVKLPNGSDPDEYLKEHGEDALKKQIDSAMPWPDYLILLEKEQFNLSKPEDKAKFVKAAIEVLKKLETNTDKELYLIKIKDISGIPLDVLRRDLEGRGGEVQVQKEAEEVLTSRENGNIKAVKFILASLLFKKDYAEINGALEEYLLNPVHKRLFAFTREGKILSQLYDEFDIDNEPALKEIIDYEFKNVIGDKKQYFEECLWAIIEQKLKDDQEKLSQGYKEETNSDKRREIAKKLSEIAQKLKEKRAEL